MSHIALLVLVKSRHMLALSITIICKPYLKMILLNERAGLGKRQHVEKRADVLATSGLGSDAVHRDTYCLTTVEIKKAAISDPEI